MTPIDSLVVLALDSADVDQWKTENSELADDALVIEANGRGWEALRGIRPCSIALAPKAALDASIGGTEMPRGIRLALHLHEGHRPAYLGGA